MSVASTQTDDTRNCLSWLALVNQEAGELIGRVVISGETSASLRKVSLRMKYMEL